MLVLSRKKGESIVLQDQIEITILEVNADTVKIGIKAPRDVEVLRKELYTMIEETNRASAAPSTDIQALKERLKNIKKITISYKPLTRIFPIYLIVPVKGGRPRTGITTRMWD